MVDCILRSRNLTSNFEIKTEIIDNLYYFLSKHLASKSNIAVMGSYDVDSVIACYLLDDFIGKVNIILPDRLIDTNNISCRMIDVALAKSSDCVIILNNNIILDIDYISLNPKDVSIAYIVLKVLQRICNNDLERYYEYVALSLIAKNSPMVGEIRFIVREGLERLHSNKLLTDLRRSNKQYLNAEDVSYYIVPKLNAPGRLKSSIYSLQYLKGLISLDELESFSIEVNKVVRKSLNKYKYSTNDYMSIIYDEDIPEGVTSLIANKLLNLLKVPSIVITKTSNPFILKGSMRGIDSYSILKECNDLIELHGFDNACAFKLLDNRLNSFLNNLKSFKFIKKDNEDNYYVMASYIDSDLVNRLEYLEPYGRLNPKPKLTIQDYVYDTVTPIKKHLKLSSTEHSFSVMIFNVNNEDRKYILQRNKISVTGYPSHNVWNNKKTIHFVGGLSHIEHNSYNR